MSLPLIAICQLAVGASFALACRFTCVAESFYRGVTPWALFWFELIWVIPVCAYLLIQYPGWSTLYLSTSANPSWALACLLAAGVGFAVGRFLLGRREVLLAWMWQLALVLFTTGLVWGTAHRWQWVGSAAAFRDHSGEGLRPLWGTSVGYVLAGALPFGALAWAFNLWRLWLMDRASHHRAASASPESIPEISAQLLEVAPRPAKKGKS